MPAATTAHATAPAGLHRLSIRLIVLPGSHLPSPSPCLPATPAPLATAPTSSQQHRIQPQPRAQPRLHSACSSGRPSSSTAAACPLRSLLSVMICVYPDMLAAASSPVGAPATSRMFASPTRLEKLHRAHTGPVYMPARSAAETSDISSAPADTRRHLLPVSSRPGQPTTPLRAQTSALALAPGPRSTDCSAGSVPVRTPGDICRDGIGTTGNGPGTRQPSMYVSLHKTRHICGAE